MEKKQMYTAVAAVVVVIIVVAAVAWYMTGNNGGSDETDDGDTYHFYLDGLNEEIDGWHDAKGSNITEAFDAAMSEDGIEYTMSNTGALTIENYPGTGEIGYGIYAFGSTEVANAWPGLFCYGPALKDITSNIVYITYSEWSYDESTGNMSYSLNPSNCEDLLTTGPFVSDDYEPLDYPNTYQFYLDGLGDLNGWYEATGDSASDALISALSAKGVSCEVSSSGAIQISDYVSDNTNGYGIFEFMSCTTEGAWPSLFFYGPALDDVVSNIIYICYSEWSYDESTGNMSYSLNPSNCEDLLTTGPFATA